MGHEVKGNRVVIRASAFGHYPLSILSKGTLGTLFPNVNYWTINKESYSALYYQ
jgi:hypothetical protein